jgi:TadE-like protein
MSPAIHRRTVASPQAGQALVEFSLVGFLLFVLVFGLIDFSRAIYDQQVMKALTREGSNLASRGTDLNSSATSVITGATPLNINTSGRVIITSVANQGGFYKITGQVSAGGIPASSRIGTGVGNPATLPPAAAPILQLNQTIFVTEVFYQYQPVTPIGKLMKANLPATLYDVAYF